MTSQQILVDGYESSTCAFRAYKLRLWPYISPQAFESPVARLRT